MWLTLGASQDDAHVPKEPEEKDRREHKQVIAEQKGRAIARIVGQNFLDGSSHNGREWHNEERNKAEQDIDDAASCAQQVPARFFHGGDPFRELQMFQQRRCVSHQESYQAKINSLRLGGHAGSCLTASPCRLWHCCLNQSSNGRSEMSSFGIICSRFSASRQAISSSPGCVCTIQACSLVMPNCRLDCSYSARRVPASS